MSRRLPPLFLGLLLALTATVGAAQETRYFEALPDLPVMPGLTESEAAGIAFDKPGGRIVTLYATGEAAPEAILGFYQETLPALGWRAVERQAWLREGERLTLEANRDARVRGGETVARFTLAPE
ncbi:hypothetical protein [Algihabitans albus]|uniref:hypothetical protein n=1 Tax=Algihabitans albus TaxID=2164067 RepID=UPI0013C300B5|nr:hypothetical protein [Algihabitans albus]